jgi:hypothetical protein
MCRRSTCSRELIREPDAAAHAERRINNNGGNSEAPESQIQVIGRRDRSHVAHAKMTLMRVTVFRCTPLICSIRS